MNGNNNNVHTVEEAATTYHFQRLLVAVQQGNCAPVMGTTGQLDSGLFYYLID